MAGPGDNHKHLLRLYEAAVSDELWPEVLHELAQSVNAVGCCIAVDNASETLIAPPVSTDLVEPIEDFINSGWYMRDLRGRLAWPLLKSGRQVLVEHDVSTEEERRNSDYHNEWLRPWDLPWWAAVGFSYDGHQLGLAILRSSRQGAFTYQEAAELATWQPHLHRAVRLAQQLSAKRAKSILDILDRLDRPAFLLGLDGSVVEMNLQAEELLNGDISISNGSLRAGTPENDAMLQRLISAALAPPFPSTSHEEEPVALRRDGRKPLIVEALPTIGMLSEVFVRTRAILLVTDLDERHESPEQRLTSFFDLTPTEAAVASRLSGGKDLTRVADEMEIAAGTARNHLKSIFVKTDTHRQSELVSLLQRVRAS